MELFRTNPSIFGWFSISHLLSAIFIIGAFILMYLIKHGTIGPTAAKIESAAEKKLDLLKDILIVIGLIIASIIIFYMA